MDVKCLLWHSEWAEYAFLKIFSLHSYFCKYVYICLKSCFASLVTKGKSISSISLVYQNLHTFFYKNTTNGVEPQFLFCLNPKTLECSFFFQYLHLIWKCPITPNLYILTLLLKNLCASVIRVYLKPSFTKFYSKSCGELVDIPCIIYHLS